MGKQYTTLTTHKITPEQAVAEYVYLPKIVHMDDHAIEVMMDFEIEQPTIFGLENAMPDARQELEDSVHHFGLVFDTKNQLQGLLTLSTILSRHTVKLLEKIRAERKDVKVNQIMVPLAEVPTVEYTQLDYARVGHVLATMDQNKIDYILVTQELKAENKVLVRGIFLKSTIHKYLAKPEQRNTAS